MNHYIFFLGSKEDVITGGEKFYHEVSAYLEKTGNKVDYVSLYDARGIFRNFIFFNFWLIWRILKYPEAIIIFDFYPHPWCFLSSLALKVVFRRKIVLCAHNIYFLGKGIIVYWASWLMAFILIKSSDLVIVNSEWTKEELIIRGGKGKRYEIVYPGVEVPQDDIRIFERNSDNKINLLNVGNCGPYKGIELLIEAVSLLPQDRYHLKIVGETRDNIKYFNKLLKLIKAKRLEKNITFTGYLTGEKKWEEYRKTDIYVHSAWAEGYGIVLLEAKFFSLPIVAVRSSAIPELIEDKINGFLVSPQDPVAFAEAIKKLISDEKLRIKMSQMSKEDFSKKAFTWEQTKQRFTYVLSKFTNPDKKTKHALFIAHSFPPWNIVGALRPFKFAKYLPEFDWMPFILTAKTGTCINDIDRSLLAQLRPCIKTYRVSGIEPRWWFAGRLRKCNRVKVKSGDIQDNRAEMSNFLISRLKIVYQTVFEVPDSHIGWVPFALLKGLRITRRENIDLLYSTSPPISGHIVALLLKKIIKKPWVADFRDSWTLNPLFACHYLFRRKINEWIEQKILQIADIVTVTSNLTAEAYRTRYPKVDKRKIEVITNGYDLSDFGGVNAKKNDQRFVITHTGTYDRTSSSNKFLEALGDFLQRYPQARPDILVRFVGSLDNRSRDIIDSLKLWDVVEYLGYMPYQKSLESQAESDVLLLTRSSEQGNEVIIPAKFFEYLILMKPILALIPPEGEAAGLIRKTKSGVVISPDDKDNISKAVFELYSKFKNGTLAYQRDNSVIACYERKHLTSQLAGVFNDLV